MARTKISYAFKPAPRASLPIAGTKTVFPVRRIYCVGRNYAEHAIEMGHDPTREPPFFFQKNPDNLVAEGGNFPYPGRSHDVHHEIELVVAIAKGGSAIAAAEALWHVFGYAVGLDMTRRDLQGVAKKLGRPWELAKAFEHAAPCSAIVPAAAIGHPSKGAVRLDVNGETRQVGDLGRMIWSVPETIAELSTLFTLAPGDLVFTGTPAGVGPVRPGDELVGSIEGVGTLRVRVV
ncbi:MAG: fumarylacetoacetate hydrolase family protein [Alphaproteobacteria bacterium]